MDCFISQTFTPAQLISLNDTRMYNQVTLLSGIVSADGLQLNPSIVTDSAPDGTTPYTWPRSYRISPNQFLLWYHALELCFLPPHANHQWLTQPLGNFLHSSHPHWTWWLSATLNSLFQHVSTTNGSSGTQPPQPCSPTNTIKTDTPAWPPSPPISFEPPSSDATKT
jgi:hypothetical protein